MVDPITNMPIVILRDKDGQRVLPIWVGVFEANAIALQIENVAAAADDARPAAQRHPRPQGDIEKIVVSTEGEHVLRADLPAPCGEATAIDARPSDAIALALRTRRRSSSKTRSSTTRRTVDFARESRLDSDGCRSGSRTSTRRDGQVQDVAPSRSILPSSISTAPLPRPAQA
jgi:hypothetical protein